MYQVWSLQGRLSFPCSKRSIGGTGMEKYMIIDGERVSFTDEKNILAVIRKARNYFTDILLLLRFIHLWCMPYVMS